MQQVQSTERQSSLPDQPGAHFNKLDENDHMKAITAPFGGDQLTRVRFAVAEDLRSGSPFVFHTKMSFLQVLRNNNFSYTVDSKGHILQMLNSS